MNIELALKEVIYYVENGVKDSKGNERKFDCLDLMDILTKYGVYKLQYINPTEIAKQNWDNTHQFRKNNNLTAENKKNFDAFHSLINKMAVKETISKIKNICKDLFDLQGNYNATISLLGKEFTEVKHQYGDYVASIEELQNTESYLKRKGYPESGKLKNITLQRLMNNSIEDYNYIMNNSNQEKAIHEMIVGVMFGYNVADNKREFDSLDFLDILTKYNLYPNFDMKIFNKYLAKMKQNDTIALIRKYVNTIFIEDVGFKTKDNISMTADAFCACKYCNSTGEDRKLAIEYLMTNGYPTDIYLLSIDTLKRILRQKPKENVEINSSKLVLKK